MKNQHKVSQSMISYRSYRHKRRALQIQKERRGEGMNSENQKAPAATEAEKHEFAKGKPINPNEFKEILVNSPIVSLNNVGNIHLTAESLKP